MIFEVPQLQKSDILQNAFPRFDAHYFFFFSL